MNEVLNYWFGEIREEASYFDGRMPIWFGQSESTDREIRERFEPTVKAGARGELEAWKTSPRGRLALLILFDQFPRNIYRGTRKAFAFDPMALAIALNGIEARVDKLLHPIERSFFYLPLEHSESLEVQEKSIQLFRELADSAPVPIKAGLENSLDYAVKHYDIIERFGRFPHRNAILGRETTPEEREFLQTPGSSF